MPAVHWVGHSRTQPFSLVSFFMQSQTSSSPALDQVAQLPAGIQLSDRILNFYLFMYVMYVFLIEV